MLVADGTFMNGSDCGMGELSHTVKSDVVAAFIR